MPRQIVNSFSRSLSIASAALVIHIGSAAAATPQSDFQRQVSALLAGNIASRSSMQASSPREEATGSKVDAQQFARQLLLGWSASLSWRARSAAQSRKPAAPDDIRQASPARSDIQVTVQQLLLGVHRAARGAS